jgi:SAM-dependent methyltransferase
MLATKPQFNSEAGPRQTKRVTEAVRALEWRGKTHIQITGVVGGEEHRAELTQPFSEPSAEASAALYAIGEQFGWRITSDNGGAIVAALEEATQNLVLPVEDFRRTADEAAQLQTARQRDEQERDGQRQRVEASRAAILAKRPAGAEALILAELDQDDSDSMTDYHNHRTTRVVAIGWRTGKREDFRQLHKAAAGFPETAHLGLDAPADVEHRENWSMGSGNYLKAGHDDASGWRVVSREPERLPFAIIEDALPVAAPASATAPASGAYRIEKHHHTKHGFDMFLVILSDRVKRDKFDCLRASCEEAGGWYSRQWGRTPGGFAFKAEEAAVAWAAGLNGSAPAPASEAAPAVNCKPEAPAGNPVAARLRQLADAMTEKVEHLRRPMTQNTTPKRMKEYNSRLHDAGNEERTQRALRALADAHDAGTIPAELAGLRTKAVIGPMVAHGIECRGYYDVVSTGMYRNTTPTAVALQTLMEVANTAAQREADAAQQATEKLRRMEDELRFCDFPGFFPTPRPIIDTMIERARIEPAHSILEPSAGKGDIADAVREVTGNPVAVCEVVPRLRDILEAKGHAVQPPAVDDSCDFLAYRFSADRILMNPPFERGQDAEHIRHAYECLKPGGRLVAICSAGPFFRSDRKSEEFRAFIDRTGADVEDLPADAFQGPGSFRQTGVATQLVVIDKAI